MAAIADQLASWAGVVLPLSNGLRLGRTQPARHPHRCGGPSAGPRRPAHRVDDAHPRRLRCGHAGLRRRATQVPRIGRDDGTPECGARLAALHLRLARHVHGRSAGSGRRCGPQRAAGERIAAAMALAVPSPAGVQRACGTDVKAQQVGIGRGCRPTCGRPRITM